jgi:hypothetical protein
MEKIETVIEPFELEQTSIRKGLAVKKLDLGRFKKEYTKVESSTLLTPEEKETKLKTIQTKIDNSIEEIVVLEDAKATMKAEVDDDDEKKILVALNTVRSEMFRDFKSLSYIIKEGEFVFISDRATTRAVQNVVLSKYNPTQFVEVVANILKLHISDLPPLRVKQLFMDNQRAFEDARYTIKNSLWDSNDIFLPFEHFKEFFISNFKFEPDDIQPDDSMIIDYYDQLIYSIAGGKSENIEHIELWILQKIINYQKQLTTPDLVIVADVGANGKGILMGIMKRMIPGQLVGQANTKTLNGNFNAIMLGKLLVFFDDQNNEEYSIDTIKEASGAEDMIFEPKGKDQFQGEKTYSSVFFSQQLPFKLSSDGKNDGVDRRFSVMRTNITFFETLMKNDPDLNPDNIKVCVSRIVNDTLYNRVNIAKWFKHLQDKHPQVNESFELNPLHGVDYYSFIDDQKSDMDIIWERLIVPVLKNPAGCIPIFVIKEIMAHQGGKAWKESTIHKRIKELAMRNKIDLEIKRTQFDIVYGGQTVIGTRSSATARKVVVALKNPAAKEFDWNLISEKDYDGVKSIDGKYVGDADYCFS